jgi:hypothetical protein
MEESTDLRAFQAILLVPKEHVAQFIGYRSFLGSTEEKIRDMVTKDLESRPDDPLARLAAQRVALALARNITRDHEYSKDGTQKVQSLLMDGFNLDDENMDIHREALRAVAGREGRFTDSYTDNHSMERIMSLIPTIAYIADAKFSEQPDLANWDAWSVCYLQDLM